MNSMVMVYYGCVWIGVGVFIVLDVCWVVVEVVVYVCEEFVGGMLVLVVFFGLWLYID